MISRTLLCQFQDFQHALVENGSSSEKWNLYPSDNEINKEFMFVASSHDCGWVSRGTLQGIHGSALNGRKWKTVKIKRSCWKIFFSGINLNLLRMQILLSDTVLYHPDIIWSLPTATIPMIGLHYQNTLLYVTPQVILWIYCYLSGDKYDELSLMRCDIGTCNCNAIDVGIMDVNN